MSSNTETLNLLKMDPVTDGNSTFNIETMLNDNWDKLDAHAKAVLSSLLSLASLSVKNTGDTMTGHLALSGDYIRLLLKDSTKGYAYLEKAKDDNGNIALYNERDTNNRSALQLYSENADEADLLRLIVKKGGVSTERRVLHTGNTNLIHKTYTATVATTWTASGNYFYQDINVSGILATDNPIVDIKPSSDNAANVQYSEGICKIFRITTAENKITVWATEKPSVAIPIQLKVVR